MMSTIMKKIILACIFSLTFSGMAVAAGGSANEALFEKAHIDVGNKASLQRGAKYFVNYCMSCHAASYSRYSRVGSDLGLSDALVKENFIFSDKKVGETMTVALREDMAKDWFGKMPPDLSVIARSRGVDWLYNYLKTFYLDESRDLGVNNLRFENAYMPHVLWELQGWQKPVYKTVVADGKEKQVIDHLELVKPGKLSPEEYDQVVRDLVGFMSYLGEPAQLTRKKLGFWVLMFLGLMIVISYMLKKEYWKDIH